MDSDLFTIIKSTIDWLVFPLIASVAYFIKKYIQRVESVEHRVNSIEIKLAIVENNIAHIRADIEEVRKGIDKILDKL